MMHIHVNGAGVGIRGGIIWGADNRIILRKEDYIAIETTVNSFWFYEQVKPYVKECFVLNTHKIKWEGNKTDKIDASKIFSIFTAVAFMADVVDIERFKSVKKICSYLRTAPKVKSSNNTTHIKSTNKASRSLTCSLLTQSVNHLKVAGPYFDSFYMRLRAGKSAGKSRMALIRKVIVSAYYMLKRNQEFKWINEKNVERKKVELQLSYLFACISF